MTFFADDRTPPVDPFALRPAPLPLAALEWLVARGCLTPAAGSPLAGRPAGASGARAAAAERLRRGGVLPALPRGAEGRRRLLASGSVGRGLAVLERPRARLRLGRGTPGGELEVAQLYATAGWAVAGFAGGEDLWVGEPFPLRSLVAYLIDELACASEAGALALWPQLFQLTTALWPSRGKRADEAVSAGEVAAMLTGGPTGAERARSLLDEMTVAGLVRRGGSGVVLSPDYRIWLEPVWSGHVFEIEVAAMHPGAAAERLLFAGPSGDRVLCEDAFSRRALAAVPRPPAGEPPDERVMIFSRPGRDELRTLMGGLLGALAGPQPAA